MIGVPDGKSSERGRRWSLRLIGELCLEAPDGTAVSLSGRRERVMLAYLALAPDCKESRLNLIGLLWGDRADSTMLDNLRTCLWSLRKSLGDQEHELVLSEREWIRLDTDMLDVDFWRFKELLDRGGISDLKRAVEIGSGGLLEGLDLDSEEFAEWIRDQRSRFSDLFLEALSRLVRAYEEADDKESALAVGQQILRKDPFNEVALLGIMRLYAASGRRNAALQAYRGFAENLEKELGVEPEPETQEAFKALSEKPAAPSDERQGAGDAPLPSVGPLTGGAASTSPESVAAAGGAEAGLEGREKPAATAAPEPAAAKRRIRALLRVPIWAFSGAASIALAALVAVGITFWRVPALAPPFVSGWISGIKMELEGAPPSIAVLPFRSYGDGSAELFAGAFSDGIGTALSLTSNMLVVSQSSVQRYRRNPPPAPVIAQQLGVRYLLEGSVTKFGNSVAVRVALIDTFEGEKTTHIGTYETQAEDFFALQRDVTLRVVTSLRVRLTEGEEERISQEHGTRNFRAWLLGSQGQKHLRALTANGNRLARRNYEAAVAADPDYAGAWTGLAWTYLLDARFGWGRDRAAALAKSVELAKKSLDLDDRRAATYALLGSIALIAGRYDVAKREGERAVELEYNDADSAALYALTLTYTGEPRKAVNLIERAMRLRPYPPRWYGWLLARAQRLAGRPGVAVKLLTAGSELQDESVLPLAELAAAYSAMGATIQGRIVAERIREIDPGFSVKGWLAMPAYEDPEDTKRDLKLLTDLGLPE